MPIPVMCNTVLPKYDCRKESKTIILKHLTDNDLKFQKEVKRCQLAVVRKTL